MAGSMFKSTFGDGSTITIAPNANHFVVRIVDGHNKASASIPFTIDQTEEFAKRLLADVTQKRERVA